MQLFQKHCRLCSSTDFRLSKFRLGDIVKLVVLMYPVRCQECFLRSCAFLPAALRYRKANSEQSGRGSVSEVL